MQQYNDLQREQEKADLLAVLDIPAGRRVLARLVTMAGVAAPSYAPGDALATAYNEGLRRMGLVIVGEVQAARPEALVDILLPKNKEATHER